MFQRMLTGGAVAVAATLVVATFVIGSVSGAALADEAEKDKWAEHKGDLPFIVGSKQGLEEAKFTGKPPMYFFTATW